MTRKRMMAAGIFTAILLIMIVLMSAVFTPTYYDWSQDNSSKLVYRMPRNRLQVTFLGTSQVGMGITPMELYIKHGICANQVAGGSQPMIASYFWLREIYSRNQKSLKTVVVDVSGAFADTESRNIVASAEKSLSGMHLSKNKIQSFLEMEELYPEVSALDNLIPIFRYHNRWTSLNEDDYTGLSDGRNYFYTMGYTPYYLRSRNVVSQDEMDVPNYTLTQELDTEESARSSALDEEGEAALHKIADFCRENGLQLVLIKLPKEWEDVQHDALTQLAEDLGVPALDFNMPDVLQKIGMDFPNDYVDVRHPNINGAIKMTDYIGDYLSANYDYEDNRGNRMYAFMDDHAAEYEKIVLDARLQKCEDLAGYLELLAQDPDRYRIFIAAKGDGAKQMPDAARQYFDSMGLTELSHLEEDAPYVGVVDGSNVLIDQMGEQDAEAVTAYGAVQGADAEILDVQDLWDPEEVEAAVEKQAPKRFRLTSGILNGYRFARINIADRKHAPNKEGLNIVVYNRQLNCYVDSAAFNTHADGERSSEIKNMSVYEKRISQSRLNGTTSVEEYLAVSETLPEHENYVTMICANPAWDEETAGSDAGTGEDGDQKSIFTIMQGDGNVMEENLSKEESVSSPPEQVSLLQYQYAVGENGNAVLTIGKDSYSVESGHTLVLTYDSRHGWLVAQRTFAG